MSNPRAVSITMLPAEAADYVRVWFQRNHVMPINPGADHWEHISRNLAVAGSGTNLVPDAHIAAMAIEYDAEVHSNDSDFNRFPGVRWRNPLQHPVSSVTAVNLGAESIRLAPPCAHGCEVHDLARN